MRFGWAFAGVGLCWVLCAAAQQQTGAPPGIPVPPAPVTPGARGGRRSPGAQVFRIHVVDGRNSTPLARAHVELWYDEPSGAGNILQTNARGIAAMPEPVGLPVRVLLRPEGYVDCRRPLRDGLPVGYNLQTIAERGIAAENTCGDAALKPEPGELILYVRPMRWYEGLNR